MSSAYEKNHSQPREAVRNDTIRWTFSFISETLISIIFVTKDHILIRYFFLFFLFASIGYIGEFEVVDDHRSGKIIIELNGRINKCGVISPRFDCAVGEIEQWIQNVLPSRGFGHLVLTTTYGIMDHEEARRKKT